MNVTPIHVASSIFATVQSIASISNEVDKWKQYVQYTRADVSDNRDYIPSDVIANFGNFLELYTIAEEAYDVYVQRTGSNQLQLPGTRKRRLGKELIEAARRV